MAGLRTEFASGLSAGTSVFSHVTGSSGRSQFHLLINEWGQSLPAVPACIIEAQKPKLHVHGSLSVRISTIIQVLPCMMVGSVLFSGSHC